MEVSDLVRQLALPSKSIVDLNFPKNAFYQQPNLSKTERSFLKANKDKIRLLATLRPQGIGIPAYEDETYRYEEIQYLYIQLTDLRNSEKYSELFLKYIPYPMVLLFNFGEEIQLVLATTHKGKQGKLEVEEVIHPEWKNIAQNPKWLESLSFTNQPKNNLKEYYDSLISKIIQQELKIPVQNDSNMVNLYQELKKLNSEIEDLTSLVKKEKQMNKRIELQLKLTHLKDQRDNLLTTKAHN